MSDNYKQRITDFFNQRTTYDSENKSHPENAQKLLNNEFYPRGNPLLNLSETQKQLLRIEYIKAIDHLIAEKGIWQEAINLYVKAWK
jgi:hypothetical protein